MTKKTDLTSKAPALPEPTKHEMALIKTAAARLRSLPARASATWSPNGKLDSPHSDRYGNAETVMNALATTSQDFMEVQLGALDHAARPRGERQGHSISGLNSALALVEAVAPQNELEATAAVQLAGLHTLVCEMLGRARQTDRTDHIELYGRMGIKASAAFDRKLEALAKFRGGGKQQVEVRHVYVNGNAVIGDVHGGGGGGLGSQSQPLAPGLAAAAGSTARDEG